MPELPPSHTAHAYPGPRPLAEGQRLVAERLCDSLAAADYWWLPPLPLVDSSESTTLFVGSSTSVTRPMLNGETPVPPGGIFTLQPCLRTQNKETFDEPPSPNERLGLHSYFWTVGSLKQGQVSPASLQQARELVCGALGIEPQNLFIVCAKPEHLSRCAREIFPDVPVRVAQDDRLTHWSYGAPELGGQGILIHAWMPLANGKRELVQLGDVIEVRNSRLDQTWVEMGIGILGATRLYYRARASTPTEKTLSDIDWMRQVTGAPDTYAADVLLDALVASLEIVRAGITQKDCKRPTPQGQVLKRYLKAVVAFATEAEVKWAPGQWARECANRSALFDGASLSSWEAMLNWQFEVVQRLESQFVADLTAGRAGTERKEQENYGRVRYGLTWPQRQRLIPRQVCKPAQ